jgi:hypothetical protein
MFTALQFKVSTHSRVARLLLMLVMAAVLSGVSVSAESEDRLSRSVHLNGLWEFTVNLPPTGLLPEHLLILGNFTRDGSFLNSSTHPPIPIEPTPTSPCCILKLDVGQGHYLRKGRRAFVLETWRFVFSVDTGEFVGFVHCTGQKSE